jgi:DNA polymerase-3 subunit epsilon
MEYFFFYILDKGRNKGERSMVWIENGAYKGYGFAPFHFNGKEPIDWKRYIAPQNENRDINTILNLFLRKDSSLRIVEY